MQAISPPLRKRIPEVRTTTLKPAEKILAKAAAAIALGVGLVALATYVMPRLAATGIAAYALGFVIYGVTSASIIVPVPGMAALVVMSGDLNPWMLAGVAGVGGALGELFGYWLGTQGRGALARSRALAMVQARMERYGGAVIFTFAAVPVLPMDAAAMVAGSTGYPVTKFLVFMAMGKAVLLVSVFGLAGTVIS